MTAYTRFHAGYIKPSVPEDLVQIDPSCLLQSLLVSMVVNADTTYLQLMQGSILWRACVSLLRLSFLFGDGFWKVFKFPQHFISCGFDMLWLCE